MSRVERLAARLEEPLLVLNPTNVAYLVGFHSSNPALLVDPAGASTLFSDFRYAERGRAVEGVEFVQTARDVVGDLAARLTGRVGFESEFLTHARWQALGAEGLELVPRRGLVEELRAVKDDGEIRRVREAAALATEAYARLAGERFSGRTERELAWALERHLRELGADSVAFPVIVAAGPNGASPHAEPGAREVRPGELVVVDAGATLDGYRSDCTRTFAAGPVGAELKRAYELVAAAQLAGLDAVRPGVSCADADRSARLVIERGGLGERFGHGLGHGVGLEIHEAPTLSAVSTDRLAANQVVTVEPGVYLPGLGGVRIEDLVVVREHGPEVLTAFPKDLLDVG